MSTVPAAAATSNPAWKIEVIVYKYTDFTYADTAGMSHHFVASASSSELSLAATDSATFANKDVPELSTGNQHPVVTMKTIDTPLSKMDAQDSSGGFSPSPVTTIADRDPGFDSYFVLWESAGWDFSTGTSDNLGHFGGLTWGMGTGPTFSAMPINYLRTDDRNLFKHEWGHAILFFYDAAGTAPKPAIDNHKPESTVNCHTGQGYVLVDDTDTNPVPNSIFNSSSGFTHDYYSGIAATSDQPTRCLGITPAAWASGGPVSKPAPSKPDLIVTSFQWSPSSPVPGSAVTFTATIKNQGTVATPSGVKHGVAFLIDGVNVSYSDTDTASLAGGASITLTANGSNAGGAAWPATRGKHTATAWVDDANRIAESNETNNKQTKAMNVYSAVAPVSTAISAGTLRSGTVSSLVKADAVSYVVNSTTSGTRTATWSGTINMIPNSTPGLQITYRGSNSTSAAETLNLWNYTTSAWITVKATTVGTTATTIVVATPGTPADYVSGSTGGGSVKIQLKNTNSTTSFHTSADQLSLGYL